MLLVVTCNPTAACGGVMVLDGGCYGRGEDPAVGEDDAIGSLGAAGVCWHRYASVCLLQAPLRQRHTFAAGGKRRQEPWPRQATKNVRCAYAHEHFLSVDVDSRGVRVDMLVRHVISWFIQPTTSMIDQTDWVPFPSQTCKAPLHPKSTWSKGAFGGLVGSGKEPSRPWLSVPGTR